ncbi:GEVED domain-containing protein [Lishizhenia tianjinensis]|nr:GEVED domain-containing protein [Lishizhenia tianjinensis]
MINKLKVAVLATVSTGMSYAQFCGGGPSSTLNENLQSLNLTGDNLSINYSGNCPGVTGVQDLTSTIADVTAGNSYQFDAVFGTCGTAINAGLVTAWVDWNGDYIFQDTEKIDEWAGTFPYTPSFSLTIPSNSVNGLVRMRVVQKRGGALPVNPCGGFTYGSMVDFSIDVSGGTGCNPTYGLNLVGEGATSVDLNWSATNTAAQYIVEYGSVGFTPGTGTNFTPTSATSQTVTGLAHQGVYDFYIRSICGAGDTSAYMGPVEGNTFDLGQFMEWDELCPTTGFIDISSTGTDLLLGDDDEHNLTMPFPFFYQGNLVTSLRIGNNGGVLINNTTSGVLSYMQTSIANGMFPFIQDLDAEINGANVPGVFTQVLGTAPNRQLVILWKDRPHFPGTSNVNPVTFEIIIDEATQDFWYVYDDVDFGNPSYDFGKDAEIGIRGDIRDLEVSMNSNEYLQNNSCVHFFNTDCPKVSNITNISHLPNELTVTWNAGLGNESNWTIEWGLPGFTPGSGIGTATSTTNVYTITNLTEQTEYEVYVYADCSSSLSSSGISEVFETSTTCAEPFGVFVDVAVDTITPNWNWMSNGSSSTAASFNIRYGQINSDFYAGNFVNSTNLSTMSEEIVDPTILSSGVYHVYMQAVCGTNDTSAWVGPLTVIADKANDSVCEAQELPVNNEAYYFTNAGASVQVDEGTIAPPVTNYNDDMGWGTSGIHQSLWFSFVAPASGQVKISCRDDVFAAKAAVYSTTDCSDFSQYTLISANDNAMLGQNSSAPEFVTCGLTPGATYYLVHSTSSATSSTGIFSVRLSEVVVNAGVAGPTFNVCSGDTVNLFNTISGNDVEHGSWIDLQGTGKIVNDSLFTSSFLATTSYDFEYEVKYGCAVDTVVATVEIFKASSAGADGVINACKNQPINLYSGVSGNVDLGGDWYDPQNNLVTSVIPSVGYIPGQFNYDYIAGNGVCPNDTALVVVVVSGSCDFLGLEELEAGALEVYPNPANGQVTVRSTAGQDKFNLQIIDVNGRVVYSEDNFLNQEESNTVQVDTLTKGMYIFRLYNDSSIANIKVIVE